MRKKPVLTVMTRMVSWLSQQDQHLNKKEQKGKLCRIGLGTDNEKHYTDGAQTDGQICICFLPDLTTVVLQSKHKDAECSHAENSNKIDRFQIGGDGRQLP